MTPAEALARALGSAPNVTGRVVRLFAEADRAQVDKVAARLASVIGEFTGEPWPAEDVTALAEGIAGGGGA